MQLLQTFACPGLSRRAACVVIAGRRRRHPIYPPDGLRRRSQRCRAVISVSAAASQSGKAGRLVGRRVVDVDTLGVHGDLLNPGDRLGGMVGADSSTPVRNSIVPDLASFSRR